MTPAKCARGRILKTAAWALILLISAGLTIDLFISQAASDRLFDSIEKIPAKKTGLLLGTSYLRKNRESNLFFSYRIEAAAKLFHGGKIRTILASGARHGRYYDETKEMIRELEKAGVPRNAIMTDTEGFRTMTSLERASTEYGINDFIIISQKFHNERALYIADSLQLKAIAFNARDPELSYRLKTRIREVVARIRAIIDIHLFDTGEQ